MVKLLKVCLSASSHLYNMQMIHFLKFSKWIWQGEVLEEARGEIILVTDPLFWLSELCIYVEGK